MPGTDPRGYVRPPSLLGSPAPRPRTLRSTLSFYFRQNSGKKSTTTE